MTSVRDYLQGEYPGLVDVAHDADGEGEEAGGGGSEPSGSVLTSQTTAQTLQTRVLVQQTPADTTASASPLIYERTKL